MTVGGGVALAGASVEGRTGGAVELAVGEAVGVEVHEPREKASAPTRRAQSRDDMARIILRVAGGRRGLHFSICHSEARRAEESP